jgi:hypothetical protein
MRKENIKRQPADFRKYADDSLNYEVKLKKFSLPNDENQVSSASRQHAAGLAAVDVRVSREAAKYCLPNKGDYALLDYWSSRVV